VQWVEYVKSSEIDQSRHASSRAPLLLTTNKAITFNLAFGFCRECTDQHQARMTHQGRCQPNYLIKQQPTAQPAPEKDHA
jgi:hypothetical protein